MDYIKFYGNLVKNRASSPRISLELIKFGLQLEYKRSIKFPDKNLPKAMQYLNSISLDYMLQPLQHPEQSSWVNLFAPAEILHAMDINPVLIEGFSSFLSGFKCEDYFIDYAEECGISQSLCSYHKAFIGADEVGLLPKPKFALTSSMVCDANINTFRYLCDKRNIPCIILDVPYTYSKENVSYLESQLIQCINHIEKITGKKFDIDKLKEIIKNENLCTKYINSYLNSIKSIYYPSTLTLQMYMMLTSHAYLGREETLRFYKLLKNDIKNYTKRKGMSIYWSHIIPFYQETLRDYFNLNPDYQILGFDLCFDYLEEMDYNNPIKALSEKMIMNNYNGPYERKLNAFLKSVENFQPDGVINFCHWGCKQSSGGVYILKEELKKKNIPMLILDGDGMDRRNSQDGQTKTRLEAFFEIINNGKKEDINDLLSM